LVRIDARNFKLSW